MKELYDTQIDPHEVNKVINELQNEEITARILTAFYLAPNCPPAKPAIAELKKLLDGQSYEELAAENALRAIVN